MNKYTLSLALSALMLSACTTSSLTPEQQAPAPESDAAFSGEEKKIDREQSVISFLGKSNIINHIGKFNDYTAVLTLDATDPADLEKASIAAEIDLTTLEVDAPLLQSHLAKEDFFDMEQYPTATFTSTGVRRLEDNRYEITGELTVKGLTKTVTVEAEITDKALTAEYDFPRQEFGIGNDSYGEKLLEPMVPVEVKLIFEQ